MDPIPVPASAPVALRADPRRATMLSVAMVGGIAVAAFLGVVVVVQRSPPAMFVIPLLLAAAPLWGLLWARNMRRNLSVSLGPDALTYTAASGKTRSVAYRDVARIEVLSAPTMHAAKAASGVLGGAAGSAVANAALRASGSQEERLVPVRVKLWTREGGTFVVPTDNLRHAESVDLVPMLLARGVPSEAVTQKVSRKRTLRT